LGKSNILGSDWKHIPNTLLALAIHGGFRGRGSHNVGHDGPGTLNVNLTEWANHCRCAWEKHSDVKFGHSVPGNAIRHERLPFILDKNKSLETFYSTDTA
jgi:hypothetical protein